MPINVRTTKTRDSVFDLVVEQSGLTITLKAGACHVRHQDVELLEDQVFTAEPDADYATRVTGFLARHKTSGDIVLAVDETIANDDDIEYRWPQSDYEAIYEVFRCEVPAAATDLDDVKIYVSHLMLRPQKGAAQQEAEEPVDEEAPEETPRRGALFDLIRRAQEQAEGGGE